MASTKTTDSPIFFDGLFDFAKGMDSNSHPLLLTPDTASFLTNATVRGTFCSNRAAFNKLTLNYGGNAGIQAAVENGMWQGSCFYQPDIGNPCLIAQISGRLFQFQLSGMMATVTEITIPGDPNPAHSPVAWLWQSENYVIVNDGSSLPIFYNGTTSRRSYGQETVLGTIAANFTAPAIGSTTVVTMGANYDGPFNVPVEILDPATGAVLYQTLTAGNQYFVNLTCLFDVAGTPINIGDTFITQPSVFGETLTDYGPALVFPSQNNNVTTVSLTVPYTGNGGELVSFDGFIWTVQGLIGNQNPIIFHPVAGIPANQQIQMISNGPFGNPTTLPFQAAGTLIPFSGSSAPNVTIGIVQSPVVAPAIGSVVQVQMDRPYTGPDGAIVYDGATNRQYSITAVPPVGGGTNLTLLNINDPANTAHNAAPYTMVSEPELPAGRMGVYGMGRNWVCLPDGLSFIASDLVGDPSGSQASNYRDAVLKIVENTYLSGGGVFRVPGSVGNITAMIFGATIDASLGQGPLQVYTPNIVFSCNAPVDRSTWQKLTNPILTESLISNGALGQNSTVAANGDTMFRAVDGIRSLILGQRQFSTWGNVPLSIEMSRALDLDNRSLLSYSSAVVFDNRLLMTCSPQTNVQGVYHQGLIALNFDPLASVDEKTQPLYDGLWTGINTLQLLTGIVAGVQRAFSFSFNVVESKIELYEITSDTDIGNTDNFDNVGTSIIWSIESASLFKSIKGKGPFDLVRLLDGELYVDNVIGKVDFQVFYKPDQYPCWTPWYEWSICNKNPDLQPQNLTSILNPPGFRQRIGLGNPSPVPGDPNTGFGLREGCTFQVKIVITGACRFIGGKFMATAIPDVMFAKPICQPICSPA